MNYIPLQEKMFYVLFSRILVYFVHSTIDDYYNFEPSYGETTTEVPKTQEELVAEMQRERTEVSQLYSFFFFGGGGQDWFVTYVLHFRNKQTKFQKVPVKILP